MARLSGQSTSRVRSCTGSATPIVFSLRNALPQSRRYSRREILENRLQLRGVRAARRQLPAGPPPTGTFTANLGSPPTGLVHIHDRLAVEPYAPPRVQ